MSTKCKHEIIIENLTDGELINHSLLLIKGRVTRNCSNKKLIKLQLETTNALQTREITKSVSNAGDFKILVNIEQLGIALNANEFFLNFQYCNSPFCRLRLIHKVHTGFYGIQPLYILCSNEKKSQDALTEACGIIDLNLRLVQSVYAEKLRAAGFGRHTFALHDNCKIFYSQLSCEDAWQSSEISLWQFFAKELLNSTLGSNRRLKFVAFIGCTRYDGEAVVASKDYSYANIRRHLQAHAALGSGGLALFGSAYFYAWPKHFNEIELCFANETKVELATKPDESNYRRTYCGVYASTLGAICHEIGHIFDLGHTQEGVMGNGFDYLNRVFSTERCTENLPNRVLEDKALNSNQCTSHAGLTKLKRTRNSFLEKYYEQRENDSFYFTHNCAVILAYSKWFQEVPFDVESPQNAEENFEFDAVNGVVHSRVHQLVLAELRTVENSLVKDYWVFLKKMEPNIRAVHQFKLPAEVLESVLKGTHFIFVLNSKGQAKRLPIENDNEW